MPKSNPITNFELKGWVHPITGDVVVHDVEGTLVFQFEDYAGATLYAADRGNGFLAVREFPKGVGANWSKRRLAEFAADLKKLAESSKKVAKKKVAKKRVAKKAPA